MTRLIPYLILLVVLFPDRGLSQGQNQPPTINIGLLVPDTTLATVIRSAAQQVEQANKSGGYRNREFKLVVRSTEGPWGAGSKESVALVYQDQVCAMVGSLDGRNAHLAEQVAAKSHLSYVEAFATDPTLSQAFVPWFTRVVPNDDQQAGALVELMMQHGGGKIGILAADSYDARYAAESLVKEAMRKNGLTCQIIHADSLGRNERRIIEEIRKNQLRHLAVPFDAPYLHHLLVSLKQQLPSLKIYGNLHFSMGAENRAISWRDYEGLYVVSAGPPGTGSGYGGHSAREGSAADAVALVIEAVRQVGPDREAIKDHLLGMHYDKGFTGPIAFDEHGNRTGKPAVSRIEAGKRAALPGK